MMIAILILLVLLALAIVLMEIRHNELKQTVEEQGYEISLLRTQLAANNTRNDTVKPLYDPRDE